MFELVRVRFKVTGSLFRCCFREQLVSVLACTNGKFTWSHCITEFLVLGLSVNFDSLCSCIHRYRSHKHLSLWCWHQHRSNGWSNQSRSPQTQEDFLQQQLYGLTRTSLLAFHQLTLPSLLSAVKFSTQLLMCPLFWPRLSATSTRLLWLQTSTSKSKFRAPCLWI